MPVNKNVKSGQKKINKALADAFTKIIDKFNIDQGEIADRLEYSETHLSEVLNCRKPLAVKLIKKIYEVFQINVEVESEIEVNNETINSEKFSQSEYIELLKDKIKLLEKVNTLEEKLERSKRFGGSGVIPKTTTKTVKSKNAG